VLWNEEGHRYAWRMMLRAKTGSLIFTVIDNKTGEKTMVQPNEFLTQKQVWSMTIHPDMIWQFVQFLKKHYAAQGKTDVSIYARSFVTINKRPAARFIDPEIDLAKVSWQPFEHANWILPEPEFDLENTNKK
jgi:hypothetical protein